MCGDSTREKLAKFALDEWGYITAVVVLTRKEGLHVAREHLIKHRLFGLARTIRLFPASTSTSRMLLRQILHETE